MTTRVSTHQAPERHRAATRGVLFVHSAPSALCPHIEWAVGGVLGVAVSARLDAAARPGRHLPGRVVLAGDAGSAAALASALRGWNHLRFEVTEEPTAGSEGARYSYTPELGVFHAVTGLHGDIMIPEDRLKAAVVKAALGDTTLLGWRSTSCSASPGTTSWSRSGTPARAPRCAGCTRSSEDRRPQARPTQRPVSPPWSLSERDVAVRAAATPWSAPRRRSPGRCAERVADGSTTSSTTPISTALSTPPAIRSCSAASSASTCGRRSGATSASLRRCRIRTRRPRPSRRPRRPARRTPWSRRASGRSWRCRRRRRSCGSPG